MTHIALDIIFFFAVLVILLFVHFRRIKYKETSSELVKILEKNIDLLIQLYKKQEIVTLKNNIKIYSMFQIILKIAKADYITFFKYDYTTRKVLLDFILSIDANGSFIQNSVFDNLPMTAISFLNVDDKDLYTSVTKDFQESNRIIYDVLVLRKIEKVYYQNIFKDTTNPVGFIVISYKNINYIISEADKSEILRMIEKIKIFL
jgi:hypothetical protein